MCNPLLVVAIASVAISAASAGSQYMNEKSQAKKAEQAYQDDYTQQLKTVKLQQQQVTDQESLQLQDIQRNSIREKAALRVASGESGVTGLSMTSILNDVHVQNGFESAKAMHNADNQKKQIALEAEGLRSRTRSGLNQIHQANGAGAGLQIAGAAVNAYGNYNNSLRVQ